MPPPFVVHGQTQPAATHSTERLHHVFAQRPTPPRPPCTAEKVYRAFLEAEALAKWLPPYGFTCTVHHLELVGGSFRMSFHQLLHRQRPFPSAASTSELVPHQRIRPPTASTTPTCPARCG